MHYRICRNCREVEGDHLSDGACLFEPTYFEPSPYTIQWTVTGRLSSSGNLQSLPRRTFHEVK